MKNFFNQLFCSHIYKIENEEYLKTKTIDESVTFIGYYRPYFNEYNYYAQHEICVKCGKTRIIEIKKKKT